MRVRVCVRELSIYSKVVAPNLRYLGTEITQKLMISSQKNFRKVPIYKNARKKFLGLFLAEEKPKNFSVLAKTLNLYISKNIGPTDL